MPPRRNSILPETMDGQLTPVQEINEEDEPEFIFTITNSRGEAPSRPPRAQRTIGPGPGGGRGVVRFALDGDGGRSRWSRDKLTDAQRIGTDAPPSYDQVITERSNTYIN